MRTLLLIEDDPIMGESLTQRFQIEGFEVSWARRLSEATVDPRDPGNPDDPGAPGQPWDAVICDVRLPDGLATEWFAALPAEVRARPWFFLTGYGSVDDAVAAIRAGAREYLTKPFDIERLVELVQGAVMVAGSPEDDAVLGVSVAMRRIEAMLRKLSAQRVSVLLTGESGVGKEVAAQLIHRLDPRSAQGKFIPVNCAAVPDTMLEAEFFGYEKGAFSGALRTHRGFLERADGGTLFLDEVGELPASMQAKLLRALQERCFFRLGAEGTTRSDFRVIAATNRDLYAAMSGGEFREDLFYRLAVIRITLPPLRDRPEDIHWLTERMLAQIALEQGRPLAVSESYMRSLLVLPWKGNARELRSHLEQSVVFSDSGILDLVPASDQDGDPKSHPTAEGAEVPFASLQSMVQEAERAHIRRAQERCGRSVARTAELLGISRKTLWEKMKRLGIPS